MNLTKALELITQAKVSDNKDSINELEQLIMDAIAINAAKSSNKLTAYRTLKKILDHTIKTDVAHPAFHGAWIDPITGKQYVSNGYMLIELNTPIDGLPQLDSKVTRMNIKPIFDMKDHTEELEIDAVSLQVKFKQLQAEAKTKKVKTCTLTNNCEKLGVSLYSLTYLNDVIAVLGNTLTAYGQTKPNRSIILESEVGRAFICPIYLKEKEAETNVQS